MARRGGNHTVFASGRHAPEMGRSRERLRHLQKGWRRRAVADEPDVQRDVGHQLEDLFHRTVDPSLIIAERASAKACRKDHLRRAALGIVHGRHIVVSYAACRTSDAKAFQRNGAIRL
jgi:hypothetical protein